MGTPNLIPRSVKVSGTLEATEGFNLDARYAFEEDFAAIAGSTAPAHIDTDVQATATADYVTGDGTGVFALGLTAADAAEAAQFFGHELDIVKKPVVEFRVKLDGAPMLATIERFVVGVASAHANAEDGLDAVATNAWFRVEGDSLNLLYESDDGTTDDDDNDSGVDIVDDTYLRLGIDFSVLSSVKFLVNGAQVGTTDMSDATGALRIFACIQRDDDTGTEAARTLEVDYYKGSTTR